MTKNKINFGALNQIRFSRRETAVLVAHFMDYHTLDALDIASGVVNSQGLEARN
jgi:hypothetical protein